MSWVYQLLDERGENYRLSVDERTQTDAKSIFDINTKTLSALFFNRIYGFDSKDTISFEYSILPGSDNKEKQKHNVLFRFVKFIDELSDSIDKTTGEKITFRRRKVINGNPSNEESRDLQIGFLIKRDELQDIILLDRDLYRRISFRESNSIRNFQFIRTGNFGREINGKLWDNITLSEKEEFVINALSIIEPRIERIAFVGNEATPRLRTPVIKLKNSPEILPIRSMGDGINRILSIILALVNADNGFLLIDEFENGLHHSVQEKLWEIIFKLSMDLNVQVFATTHSDDCITGFSNVLSSSTNRGKGKLIRLDSINDRIVHVEYNTDELRVATSQNIETR
jgi:hypothetical protein